MSVKKYAAWIVTYWLWIWTGHIWFAAIFSQFRFDLFLFCGSFPLTSCFYRVRKGTKLIDTAKKNRVQTFCSPCFWKPYKNMFFEKYSDEVRFWSGVLTHYFQIRDCICVCLCVCVRTSMFIYMYISVNLYIFWRVSGVINANTFNKGRIYDGWGINRKKKCWRLVIKYWKGVGLNELMLPPTPFWTCKLFICIIVLFCSVFVSVFSLLLLYYFNMFKINIQYHTSVLQFNKRTIKQKHYLSWCVMVKCVRFIWP